MANTEEKAVDTTYVATSTIGEGGEIRIQTQRVYVDDKFERYDTDVFDTSTGGAGTIIEMYRHKSERDAIWAHSDLVRKYFKG